MPVRSSMGHRLEAADAALVEQAHEKGLHRVVMVVPQGDLVDALGQQRFVQRAASHFGAHGAGVLLLSVVKNDRADLAS